MNTDKLSNRLEMVASFVPIGARLADIGSDHAYLPCYLAKKNLIDSAIAGEVVEGPFVSASKQVQADGLSDKITVRMGNGLDVLQPGEVDCITIAGMGGALIASILERGKAKLENVKRLILQPNISAISIRLWLIENGWELIEEEILEEEGKIYEILVAEKGDPLSAYSNEKDRSLLFGPFLITRQQDAFMKKWSIERDNWKR
ncbi:MAG: tRNA (adenine(22)-N(1))-methyltransferase TrmK, partial [Bacillota bacterium]|nr:tRNA (adenine(22)-N(1))-methyltransferase TrmK [Bacillota bacterium]